MKIANFDPSHSQVINGSLGVGGTTAVGNHENPSVTTTAHTAAQVSIADAGGYYTGTTVEAALQEAAQQSLDDLTDVVITSPVAAQRLRYDGTNWVNSSLIWRPAMTYNGTNWIPVVDGSGNAVMTEA